MSKNDFLTQFEDIVWKRIYKYINTYHAARFEDDDTEKLFFGWELFWKIRDQYDLLIAANTSTLDAYNQACNEVLTPQTVSQT